MGLDSKRHEETTSVPTLHIMIPGHAPRMSRYDYHHHNESNANPKKSINSSSSIDSILSGLPSAIAPHIQKTGEDEVEMQFSLAKLTKLQKQGMGAADAEKVLVRLRLGGKSSSTGYCVHLSNERMPDNKDPHTPWLLGNHSKAPNQPYCHGIPNRAAYHLSRTVWRLLKEEFESLGETYVRIASNVADLASRCVVCGTHHSVHLRRSTPCKNPECHALFAAANFEIHIRDVWTSPAVVDLIFSSMYATTLRINSLPFQVSLLRDCPLTQSDTIEDILNLLPPMTELGNDLARSMTKWGSKFSLSSFFRRFCLSRPLQAHLLAESLIWACTSYRGFLTPAAGEFHIPGFGNAPQFLLANSSPVIEERFARELIFANGKSRVLFHGTKLDTLHSILRSGLKNLSRTSLERNGAFHGNGVYMSSSVHICAMFAQTMDHEYHQDDFGNYITMQGVQLGWNGSRFNGPGALQVCEVAGAVEEPSEYVFVLRNVAKIMIRYVILLHRSDLAGIIGYEFRPKHARQSPSIPYFERAFTKLKSGSW